MARKKKVSIKINFIPVEGDLVGAVTSLINTSVGSVLEKHGVSLRIEIEEIVRNYAKV